MKLKILMMLVFSFLLISFINAQDRPPNRPPNDKKMPSPKEMAKKELGELKDELNLTDNQIPFVQKILEDFYKNMQSLFESGSPSRDDIDKLVADKDNDIKSVLSDDQWSKYLDFKEKHKNDIKHGPGDKGPGDRQPPDKRD
jgi:Spy/CpxP family protein refolding chaperone